MVDASVALSWILPGEETSAALHLRDEAVANLQLLLIVPPTFWYEVANVLWVAKRRKRLNRDKAIEALAAMFDFGFTIWNANPATCLQLSSTHNLAVYDTAYLAIALEEDAVLWTMDQTLKKTAEELGIKAAP